MSLHLHSEYIKFCSLEQCSFELKDLLNYWTKLDQLSLFSFYYSMNSAGLCMTDHFLYTCLNKSMVHRQNGTITQGTKFQHEVV